MIRGHSGVYPLLFYVHFLSMFQVHAVTSASDEILVLLLTTFHNSFLFYFDCWPVFSLHCTCCYLLLSKKEAFCSSAHLCHLL